MITRRRPESSLKLRTRLIFVVVVVGAAIGGGGGLDEWTEGPVSPGFLSENKVGALAEVL